MANDQDTFHADLCELLTILGMGDHSRPQSPHEVFQEALGVLRERLSLPAPTPTPACLGEREAVARTGERTAILWIVRDGRINRLHSVTIADAIIAQHIEPLRTENETLRAERDGLKTALDEMIANIDPTIDLIQRQRSWQAYGERLEREADAALADEIQTQRKRVVEMKAQVKAAEAERDAAIARAEEAERKAIQMERGKWAAMGLQQGGAVIIRQLEDRISILTAKLAQAEGEIATMRAALVAAEDALSDASSGLSFNDTEGRQNAGQALQDLRNVIARFEEHPHGD